MKSPLTEYLNSKEYNYAKMLRQEEWSAWKKIVLELKNLGIDINEQDNLTGSIRQWADIRELFKIAKKEANVLLKKAEEEDQKLYGNKFE